jgi:ATP-dependent Lhr-like helicase
MVERFREQLTTEKLADRLARILKDAEAALAKPDPRKRRRRGTAA